MSGGLYFMSGGLCVMAGGVNHVRGSMPHVRGAMRLTNASGACTFTHTVDGARIDLIKGNLHTRLNRACPGSKSLKHMRQGRQNVKQLGRAQDIYSSIVPRLI